MEKISRIVRGNARTASVDLKSAAPVRPGMPSFGRPVGESTLASGKTMSTAAKAVAIHKEMVEGKKVGGPDQVVQTMAESFFMNRLRGPQPGPADGGIPGVETPNVAEPDEGVGGISPAPIRADDGVAADLEDEVSAEAPEVVQPRGYKPRGSYIDVRA